MKLSASEIVLEYFCPAMGMVFANIMFAAPLMAVRKAVQRANLGDLNPTPWAFMTGNTVGWITYSFLIQNYFIFFANAPGFLLSVWFNMCAAKLQYQNHMGSQLRNSFVQLLDKNRQSLQQEWDKTATATATAMLPNNKNGDEEEQDESDRTMTTTTNNHLEKLRTMVWLWTAETTEGGGGVPAPHEKVVVLIVIIWTILISIISLARDVMPQDTQTLVIGVAVNLNLLFFYGAPLSTIASVLQTRSSATIHIWTMLTNTANGTFWMIYGIAVRDYFIAVPNGIGAALGILQMILCLLFPHKTTTTATIPIHSSSQRIATSESNENETELVTILSVKEGQEKSDIHLDEPALVGNNEIENGSYSLDALNNK
eukprot:CAMPEP_0198291888 /NCGR_PEP_ID=MMETSP1449-20131203/9246_1 /TAXON_ID=420275 /ORGANISM="Attheya septentrionalis, Strain CCMP2084" /LENGTH=370 /DNA_ID=CAMNT_0043990573 /DNA_START=148 /DNA_END=1260 /DNA_ORIENTATION=+